MKHIAKKRFGQNFLTDQSVIASLVEAISPKADDLMVEIGPGLGALTKPLLKKLNHLHVVEVDRDIIAWMQKEYAPSNSKLGNITIHNADALKFDFTSLGNNLRVTGNLPYNISTPILFHLLDNVSSITDMHFMLQKEVVERMVAEPSTPAYGRLSVMLQYRLKMDYLITVPPEAFVPAPKVESAFVRCVPHANLPFVANDETMFAKVVLAAFGQRRKTLRNTLKGLLEDDGFTALNINSQLRAENLSVADFVAIANYLHKL
ncbi:16S rRNA (adenine(1518)-N(6)/adenine(1519)-N(6))-dimethyltransferase RsmA [Methylotenera sp.]|uniref:16S rRNA (adenine(1518)-N(6)/adenine(1519)-N(6))- dimethyltransferase RsmA n=1 Tax=Methylotenera sp. TaxID=2051956 RepID=UPI002728D30E|nr:16S rRNA (adenine(1518)-N(6)/adenine(1519)-N(6))-dimethyltransferase RsmA [Methylotenera sp.]MDO9205008.1 16S rRNA (adenine(1518)-N(6)/adenine(1519)-N(6))-dimethyltransferase RsmA [Methylotenera sp.]MDP1521685.1 16S rRNA (adenine(1518)-N(6)/adenine(1519)-N(6))-dimethyltransferase RsmA [Methylotenera sp.]MDP2071196.1 16S rRNA (adenine(1518)-N(6)/adenine(1519)-N(6))-dimethyltransferase RsmA [Methylotenera sp.]MDP2230120.1 16S rRNA (adenine(1518)-N(6)/adenine(1519)-N(6))-dimethyltransferase Rsm